MNIICLPILLLICIIMHQITVYRRNRAISEIIENELLECSKEYDKIITMRKKCSHARHDLFNSISILEEYAASIKNNSEELTRMLDDAHRIVDKSRSLNSIEYCNNPVISILLAIKVKHAKERNIIPNFNISIPDDMNIQIYDLVCLLSNIIDNAIEATEKIDSEAKEISMTIHVQSEYLCIECLNPFKEDLNPIKRKYLTTKEDTSNHGLGTQIIADIVNTYNGYSKASVLKDNRYSLMVAL
ncbi:MAG: ATP-binding protein, partial [Lachnospiraceae bacterium]|nr:ATP-binding protein [Lachnospiraceae bacterium]